MKLRKKALLARRELFESQQLEQLEVLKRVAAAKQAVDEVESKHQMMLDHDK